ncbi:hypothetical protein DFH06DRAFT_1327760 [Mycena polygramma]|nr:hypothetical protein DFH06DRAFT_1327760 [Mycena polygramma]
MHMHLLERASRSFTTADSSTRNGDADSDYQSEDLHSLPSPPTSYDEEGEHEGEHEGEGEGQSGEETIYGNPRAAAAPHEEEEGEEEQTLYHNQLVLLALAPPIGNWLTGGDHLKDLLLLLLLSPGASTTPRARGALPLPPCPPRPPSLRRAQSELRRLELGLLLVCLLTPALGVCLLRSLASFTTSTSSSPSNTSTNSSSSMAAGAGAEPSPDSPPPSFSSSPPSGPCASSHPGSPRAPAPSTLIFTRTPFLRRLHPYPDPQLSALEAKVARLEATVARLAQREDALYGYVEDALAPIEKGVRRVERRVRKLCSARKNELAFVTGGMSVGGGGGGGGGGQGKGTIFIPAPNTKTRASPKSLIASWFGSPPSPSSTSTGTAVGVGTAYVLPPPSPTLAGKHRALDPIPEEGEVGPSHSPTARSTQSHPIADGNAHRGLGMCGAKDVLPLLGALIRQWLAAGLALALYPLYLVLLPVRGRWGFWLGLFEGYRFGRFEMVPTRPGTVDFSFVLSAARP